MSLRRALVASTIVGVAVLLWSGWPSRAASPGPFGTAKVRLYSNGQVVGQWEAVGEGRVEGSTFVFPVRQGVRDVDVRISGDFSFEVQP